MYIELLKISEIVYLCKIIFILVLKGSCLISLLAVYMSLYENGKLHLWGYVPFNIKLCVKKSQFFHVLFNSISVYQDNEMALLKSSVQRDDVLDFGLAKNIPPWWCWGGGGRASDPIIHNQERSTNPANHSAVRTLQLRKAKN